LINNCVKAHNNSKVIYNTLAHENQQMDVDLEEIQCPLCKEQFTEKTKVPLLLPDCGHSYCI